MSMEFKEKTYKVVDWHELDRFITEELGKTYECVPTMEWSNDVEHHVHVTGTHFNYDRETQTVGEPKYLPGMDKDEKQEVVDWLEGKDTTGVFGAGGAPSVGAALEYLCEQGKLEAGNYLIEVSW